jgi:SAM-dependent methyltransferase
MSPPVQANAERWSAKDDAWRGYHYELGRIFFDERIAKVLKFLVPQSGVDYLDIGCANGILTRAFGRRLNAGTTIGIDLLEKGPDGIRFLKANLDSNDPLPFKDHSFNVITCLETLEHVHDTDRLLLEIRRLLRPSGYAVVSVPRLDALLNLLLLLFGYLPPAIECSVRFRWGAPERNARVSGHVSHFTKRGLLDCIESNGFSVEGFAQASIYDGWRHSRTQSSALQQQIVLRALSWIPFKKDVMIVRIRPSETG